MSKVSVIMPCFNHANYLRQSVNSVLTQSHKDLELIIIDDNSTDNSGTLIEDLVQMDFRIKAIRHSHNCGPSKSRNDGLHLATGQYIGFCDADDIWEKGKLECQLALLNSNKTYDLVYSDSSIINENGLKTGDSFSDLFPPPKQASGSMLTELIRGNFINTQTVLMRHRCVETTGYFDERINVLEDWWYWIQLASKHRFLYCAKTLARYRIHSQSTNRTKRRKYMQHRIKVLNRILTRFPDLANGPKGEIFYHLGVNLRALGRRRIGTLAFRESFVAALCGLRIPLAGKAAFRLCKT
jgi:glycosyltransferase involved in cell wall biosynthesis